MNTNEREPLLSDDVVRYKNNAFYVRDFYEDLIASGKLRVVENVEAIPCADDLWARCGGCGTEYFGAEFNPYCPGCGNKIKR